jgi:hypothetical protein
MLLHGLKVFFPQINISNKRGPAPQGKRGPSGKINSPKYPQEWFYFAINKVIITNL